MIARAWGVVIPEDVEFHVDEVGELHKNLTARAPRVDKSSGERVYWSDLARNLTSKVPIRVWSGILASDEAIVAVLAHEMHALMPIPSPIMVAQSWPCSRTRCTSF
ncbi:MAG: hypothetical protein ACP5XB_02190 [Isosphaeraceae bacterium]